MPFFGLDGGPCFSGVGRVTFLFPSSSCPPSYVEGAWVSPDLVSEGIRGRRPSGDSLVWFFIFLCSFFSGAL